ncbi:MAG: hypothetical protein VYB52_00465 [Candidatus Neomarinimicrobiota bacterium]|nr:hypothetical protein [Candidatus Neomarinimicrobiota bacterium]
MKKSIISLFLSIFMVYSQSSFFEEDIGYINITSDSSHVPIYVDGSLVGHTPIKKPIPLIPGNHFISIHPLSISKPFLQYGPNDSMKHIYIINNDTINLHLNTFLLHQESIRRTKEDFYSRYINIGLSILVIWQFLILSS